MIEPADSDAIGRAAARLRAGQVVVFPTETVYGLGADATSDAAVAEIFAAKGRPRLNPLIAHVPDLQAAARIAVLSDAARALAEAFWPGPLSLVLPRRGGAVSDLACAGLATVAVRVPAHPAALALLRTTGRPVAAPSANLSGRLSPTTAADAAAAMGGWRGLVLEGDADVVVGLESTIVAVADGPPRLLRPGGAPREALEAALGAPLAIGAPAGTARPSAPGMLTSHYAPDAALRLDAETPAPGEAWLGFGADPAGAETAAARRNLSPSGDLRAAAAQLFRSLRALDAEAGPGGRIAVARIPEEGLGAAINDRLRRAAAPRG